MIPKKYIGEQFYFDHRIIVDNEAQNLSSYTHIDAVLLGQQGQVRFRWPVEEGYNEIVKLDDYTFRYYVTSEHTQQLGIGSVRIEVKGIISMPGAPNNTLKPIFAGEIFKLVDSTIGKL